MAKNISSPFPFLFPFFFSLFWFPLVIDQRSKKRSRFTAFVGKTRWNFALIINKKNSLSLCTTTFEFSRICLCHTQKHAQKKAHTRTRTHRFSSNTRATRSHREIPCTTWARARCREPFSLCAAIPKEGVRFLSFFVRESQREDTRGVR